MSCTSAYLYCPDNVLKEELDRREQLVQSLTAQTEDLQTTVDTLNTELVSSNDEVERISRELDSLRSRALEDNAYESSLRERDAAELERVRREKDEWERAAMEERVQSEDYRAQAESLRRDLDIESAERKSQAQEVLKEKQTAANLQSVLEDFQTGAYA
jgi:chromosome segregation ATPase